MGAHQGVADEGRERVAGMVLDAWDFFLEQAASVNLDRQSRLPGWRADAICVHLGCWDDPQALADVSASARAGGTGTPLDVDAVKARVNPAQGDAPRGGVPAALRRSRE